MPAKGDNFLRRPASRQIYLCALLTVEVLYGNALICLLAFVKYILVNGFKIYGLLCTILIHMSVCNFTHR